MSESDLHAFVLTELFVEYTSIKGVFSTYAAAYNWSVAHPISPFGEYIIEEWRGGVPVNTANDGGGIRIGVGHV